MPTETITTNFTKTIQGYANASESTNLAVGYTSRDSLYTTGFRKKKRDKLVLPMNAYTHQHFSKVVPLQSVNLSHYTGVSVTETGNYGIANYWITDPSTNANCLALYAKNLAKLPARLNGAQFSVPLFLSDFSKTTRMFKNAAASLATWLKQPSNRAPNRDIAGSWMEYRYGWRLLLKDLYDSLCAVHDRIASGNLIAHIKVVSTSSGVWQNIHVPSGVQPSYTYGNAIADLQMYGDYDFGCALTILMRDTAYSHLQPLQQFGITNPASTLWDMLPASFVLDWFFSVGDYLRTLDIFVGREFVAGCAGYWSEYRKYYKPYNFRSANAGWSIGNVIAPPTYVKERFYKRVPMIGFPTGSPPQLDIKLNVVRVLDGIALTKQLAPVLLGRIKPRLFYSSLDLSDSKIRAPRR